MTPRHENTILYLYSEQLTRLGPWRGFLSLHSALQWPSTLPVQCLWNYKQDKYTVCCAMLGAEVPGYRQEKQHWFGSTPWLPLPTLDPFCRIFSENS